MAGGGDASWFIKCHLGFGESVAQVLMVRPNHHLLWLRTSSQELAIADLGTLVK
jgi:hypothetical protein